MASVIAQLIPLLVLAPIIIYAIAPTQSTKALTATQNWLERHNRVIVIVVSSIFGAFFFCGRALPA